MCQNVVHTDCMRKLLVVMGIITIIKTTRLPVTEVGVAGSVWSTHATVSPARSRR